MEQRDVGSFRFLLDLSQPIYEQIVQQLSGAIARGDLDLGAKIPSVRELAQGLRAAPNTVVHAYQELEREGLIETRRGQGTFVTTSATVIHEFRAKLAQTLLNQFLQQMERLGFSPDDVRHLLREYPKEGDRT
ncbi:MAG: GntR family transcriptional regulator [Sulfobacillus benefaciens]|uniref:GntR family transcriptional regulator n=1 Tax=Sulfobacillus benefaciens TaxID=453960 RepID=A0A2T2XKV4_9FIRM|nr:MAG: GntR family transcriptional regulator [Sulfobacillus benefaciens]